jgi:hypothetical protein
MNTRILLFLRHRANLYRRYRHWNREKCIFIHVPKAAGTSINRAIYGRTLGHYTISEITSTFPHLVEKCFVFSVVRNPYDRLVSAYNFAKRGHTAEMGVYKPKQYAIPEFASFELFVSEWLVHQDLMRADHIFRPQHVYLYHNGAMSLDFLGSVESLDEDMAYVQARLSRGIDLKTTNAIQRDAAYATLYPSHIAEHVWELYKQDFDMLGYSKSCLEKARASEAFN